MKKHHIVWGLGLFCYLFAAILTEDSIIGWIQFSLIIGMFICLNYSQKLREDAFVSNPEEVKK